MAILATLCLTISINAQSGPDPQPITLAQKKIKNVGTDCQDRTFHIAFRLPLKWSVQSQTRWTDATQRATTLTLHDPQSREPVGLYYRIVEDPRPAPGEAIDRALQVEVDKKIGLRARQGFAGYQIRPENCERRLVAGRQALSCIAQYNDRSGIVMSEYLTWIQSERCFAQFWVLVRPEDVVELRGRLEGLIQSLQLP